MSEEVYKTPEQTEVESSGKAIEALHQQDRESIEAGATPPVQEGKLAGKYDSPEALREGTKHALRHLGMDENYYDHVDDPQQLAELYQNLDRVISQGGNPELDQSQSQEQQQEQAEAKSVEQSLDNAGLSLNDLTQEYLENGSKLTEESIAKIKDGLGVDEETINEFIQFQESKQSRYEDNVLESVGLSRDEYSKFVEWASNNYNPEQTKAFDEAVNSGNQSRAIDAIEALKSRYSNVNGSQPNLLQGQQSQPVNDVYRSDEEMMRDMGTDLYKESISERTRVKSKVARSVAQGLI